MVKFDKLPNPADPKKLHMEQGTLNQPNSPLLSVHLKDALKNGDIKRSEIASWKHKPWTIMTFLEGKISSQEQVANTQPSADVLNDPVKYEKFTKEINAMLAADNPEILNTLREWAEQAAKGPIIRDAWEKAHLDEVAEMTAAVNKVHDALMPNLAVHENTSRNLNAAKGLNFMENVLRGTKEYVWDEFSDHPEMSAGLVIAAFMAIKSLKDTRLMKGIGYGAAGLIGYTFLRDKFGVRPMEKIAEVADQFAGKGTGDAIRGTTDTMTRVIFGEEMAGTVNGYYFDKLALHRDEEQLLFNHMLSKTPKDFLEWHDAASAWSTNRGKPHDTVPSDVVGFARDIEMNMASSSYFNGLTDAQKVDMMMDVSHRVLEHVAAQNDHPETVDDGISVLQQKYIDGSYFELKWNQLQALDMYLEKVYFKNDVEMQKRAHEIIKQSQNYYEHMEVLVRNSNGVLTMEDVLFLEADEGEIAKYNGPGASFADIGAGMEAAWGKVRDELAPGAWKDISKFFGDTVPTSISDVWNQDVMPHLITGLDKFDDSKKLILDWFDADVLPLVKDAKKAGMDYIILPVQDTEVYQLFASYGVEGGLLEIKINEIADMMESVRDAIAEKLDFSPKKNKPPQAPPPRMNKPPQAPPPRMNKPPQAPPLKKNKPPQAPPPKNQP